MRILRGAFVLLFTLTFPSSTKAGDLDLAKVSLHLKPHVANACQTPPNIPCSQYTTNGRTGVSYDAYLVVADVSFYSGIGGVSCGIDYDPALGSGVDLYSWTLCADGFEWTNSGPNGVWPAPGGGNRITWTTCQTHWIPPNGIHAVAGVFYIYAYGDDQLQVTENKNLDSGPELKVANCDGVESFLPAAYGARVDFTAGGTSPGYNPCTTQEPQCLTPETSINLNYVPVGGYKDVSFSIIHGVGLNPLQGTITENCPEYVIQSGGTYYLPSNGNSSTVQVRVAPTAPGPLNCLLNLGSTCRDVQILGTAAITPHSLLSPPSIDSTLPTGRTASLSYQLQNIGSVPLEWSTRVEFGSLYEMESDLGDNAPQLIAQIPGLIDGDIFSIGWSVLSTDIVGGFNPGRTGHYFDEYYGDLYVVVADLVDVNHLSVQASLKQHTGQKTVDRFTVHWNDVPYDVIVYRTFGNPDYASLNHIFILPDVNATFAYDPIISNADATVSGLERASRVFYLMFMGAEGRDYSVQETTHLVETFLEAGHPYPQWMTENSATPVLSSGDVASGEFHVVTSGLEPGTYNARLIVPSNSLSIPAAVLPVTLECTEGVTTLQIDPGTLNPASKGKWVNALLEPGNGLPETILLGTVRALGTVSPDPLFFQTGDADSDGVADARFRFNRTGFIEALPPEDMVEVVITGDMTNGHFFIARDTVRVLRPHIVFPHGGETLLTGTFVDTRFDLDETPDGDSVVVSYSSDGGDHWESVGWTAGQNHLNWRLPQEPSTNNALDVRAYRDGVLLGYDRSDVFSTSAATGIDPELETRTTALYQNHPNPFSTLTHIPFSMAAPGEGRIEVFNVAGMQVRTLMSGQIPAGVQEVSWDGKSDIGERLPPGLYVVRLRTAAKDESRRMFLVP